MVLKRRLYMYFEITSHITTFTRVIQTNTANRHVLLLVILILFIFIYKDTKALTVNSVVCLA